MDKRFLDDLGTNCKYLNQSDFIIKTIGRPFGASCWLINNKVEIIKSEFINENLSYVKVEFGGYKYLIIGVYMPFDNNNLDSVIDYEMNLSLLTEINKNAKKENEFDVIIGGDFNADLYRSKKFDNKLLEFININRLIALDYSCYNP